MRLHIIARGRIGRGPEAELVARYVKRMAWPTVLTELGETAPLPDALPHSRTVVLDERGAALATRPFADRLARWRDDGVRETRFLIGAADGHDAGTRDGADLLLSFGPATWPHLLVRGMLAEQLYRATSLLAGHPYHREG
ncbi:23S rRNA (pseudouridine(1915)-N(3))-methyltransferase RlmH [Glacieibacterium sp.]|uniref:23S rRNA (pseudouridine(1915)-N(3))-methyltransferase RlmH n=1 Tax=Glacieibacterium sp. TaxID=2860237 RepID=UPI003B002CBE